MTQEDKELLLRDLVARIPYGVVVNCTDGDVQPISVDFEKGYDNPEFWHDGPGSNINFNDDNIKPYLFPLSSMTEEQKKEYQHITERWMYDTSYSIGDSIDWLNKNHFDYRGLIEKGLAIDATEENNPYKCNKVKKYEVIFADLDGTLIDTLSGKTFPEGIWDMKIKLDVLDKIKELAPKYVLIVTNQGGIEKGFINEWSFRHKLEYICSVINNYCGCETYARYCTVNDANNVYRKPNTGMLEHLMEQYVGDDVNHIKSVSVMIGDASGKEGQFSDSDKKCAENFGIDYIDVNDFINYE